MARPISAKRLKEMDPLPHIATHIMVDLSREKVGTQ